MTQADDVSAWRSNPLTSKTMWTVYVSQVSLAALAWQYLNVAAPPSTAVLLALIASIAAVGITGVAGLAWTDPAVSAVRAIKGAPAGSYLVSLPPPPGSGGAS